MDDNYLSTVSTKKEKINKIIFGILLAITFLTPIFFVPVSFIPVQFGTSLLFSVGVILSVLIYVVSGLVYGSLELPRTSKYILAFMFVVPVVYTLAGISNGFSRMSFLGYTFDIGTVGFVVLAFAYMFLVSILFREGNRIFYSYFAFVVSSILLSIFLILRLVFGADFLSFGLFGSLTSTMIGSWNNVGIFFGIGALLSLLTFEMVNVSRFMKGLLTLALLLSLFFLSIVNFSIIWVVIGLVSFLFILYRVFSLQNYTQEPVSFKSKLSKIPVYSAIVLVLSVAFVIWGNILGGYLVQKLNVANIEIRPSLSLTMEIARNTISNHPLFGSGPNNFINEWLIWKPQDIVSTTLWNLDFTSGIGLIPTLVVTTGLIGILSWILFLGFYVYLGIRSIFIKMDDSFKKYLIVSSFFVSLYLWTMAFVYVPSTVVFILTVFFTGLFFASIYSSGLIQVGTKTFSSSPKEGFLSSLMFVTFIIISLGLGYGLFKTSKSLWYFQKSSYAIGTEGNINASELHMLRAIETVPMDIYYRALAEIEVLKLNAIASQDTTKVKIEDIQTQFRNTLSDAIRAGKEATNADSKNYLNWVALGRVYEAVADPRLAVEGAYEEAIKSYTEALRINPKNPSIYVLFSRLAVIGRDLEKAKEYALQAIQLKNNYLDAYFLLSQIEVEDNNIPGAIESVTAATIVDPTNSAMFFQLGLLKYNAKDWPGAVKALEEAIRISPDYANAKYFLGLSYEATKQREKAIQQFEDLKKTNPDNQDLVTILENLKAGKPILSNTTETKPETSKTLPVNEKVQ